MYLKLRKPNAKVARFVIHDYSTYAWDATRYRLGAPTVYKAIEMPISLCYTKLSRM